MNRLGPKFLNPKMLKILSFYSCEMNNFALEQLTEGKYSAALTIGGLWFHAKGCKLAIRIMECSEECVVRCLLTDFFHCGKKVYF